MSAGGITYGAAKAGLARVSENGICDTDPRLMPRVNDAIFNLLNCSDPETGAPIIPVNCMATYDVTAVGTELFLPKELENAIEVEVLDGAEVNDNSDVTQGWFSLVNPFTYIDPSAQYDNPLVDLYLQPDPDDPTILRRKYDYPGLAYGATVRVTGMKRFIPITSDADFLLVQNLQAIRFELLSIERMENNAPQEGDFYHGRACMALKAEVKKHMMDPIHVLKRKAAFDADLNNYPPGTYGYTRAIMAHQVRGSLAQGKSELSRMLDYAEMRAMEMGTFKGCLEPFEATITGGEVWFPARVESVLSAAVCGQPLPIRSIFFQYLENGPGLDGCGCSGMLIDQGEQLFPDGQRRRRYLVQIGDAEDQKLNVVAKLRWVKKAPDDKMTIRNIEALRLMLQMILHERAERWNEAAAAKKEAREVLEKELNEYLSGVQHTMPQSYGGNIGLSDIGGVL